MGSQTHKTYQGKIQNEKFGVVNLVVYGLQGKNSSGGGGGGSTAGNNTNTGNNTGGNNSNGNNSNGNNSNGNNATGGSISINGSITNTLPDNPTPNNECPQMIELSLQDVDEPILKEYAIKLQQMRGGISERVEDYVYLPIQFTAEQNNLIFKCHSKKIVSFIFERYDYLLSKEIDNRRKHKYQFVSIKVLIPFYQGTDPFMKAELWFMEYHLVKTGMIFEGRGQKIGDVHPRNILLNQEGLLKVISTASLPYETDNLQKMKLCKYADVYLSPEEIQELVVGKQQEDVNVDRGDQMHRINSMHKVNSMHINGNVSKQSKYDIHAHHNRCQAYSIGMTMLQCATLEDCYLVYSRTPLKINFKMIGDLLNIVRQRYSEFFCSTIARLLQINPKKRVSCLQLHESLRRYQTQVMNLESFQYAPLQDSFKKSHYSFEGMQQSPSLSQQQKQSRKDATLFQLSNSNNAPNFNKSYSHNLSPSYNYSYSHNRSPNSSYYQNQSPSHRQEKSVTRKLQFN